MRLISIAFAFAAMSAQANTVTLDFEGNTTVVDNWTYSQGFKLSGTGVGVSSFEYASVRTDPISRNSSFGAGANGGACIESGDCNSASFALYREDEGAFALYSFDAVVDGPDLNFYGYTKTGEYIATIGDDDGWHGLVAPLGTGGWLNLSWAYWQVSTPRSFSFAPDIDLSVDNITVSAVPIPAAVWLFGSALAGLGWLRRKKTV